MKSSRNVTIDPAAKATAVSDPAIKSVRSKRTGIEIDSCRLIEGRRYDRLVNGLRAIIADSIRENKPRLICPICSVAVSLASSKDKRFYFRHRSEDGSCPAVTRSEHDPDDIRAAKYNGARESDAHKSLKERIASSLSNDPNFSVVKVECTWRSRDRATRRKPDVQAIYKEVRLAFEAQLTTTFLDVVRGRRAFYLSEGALLIWVLRRFDPSNRRMTEDDVLFSNNSNIIVVDEETFRLSKENHRMMVRCHYREPSISEGKRKEVWHEKIVGFDELTLDLVTQRAYLYDFDAADREISQQIAKWNSVDHFRSEILFFFNQRTWRNRENEEEAIRWKVIVDKAEHLGFMLPSNHRAANEFYDAVRILESARQGRPVGFNFKKLIEVAHLVAERHQGLLLPFAYALRAYGTDQVLASEDTSRRWARRREALKSDIQANRQRYSSELPQVAILRYLFPEVADKLH